VNNAGTSQRAPFLQVSDALWQDDLDLKLFAAIRLTRLAFPGMIGRRWGRVINVLNTGAKAPPAEGAPTAVSRAAGMALTKVLSQEGAKHNVLVNALLVGLIDSDQHRRRHAAEQSNESYDEWLAKLGKAVPLGRYGKAEEFAATALFLCSDAGGYVTGTAINVDGGRSPVV
jgi:NAD(P)-dependent dehydrogenase (short-subunit alcohol dehydrogenase family)